MPPQAHHLVIFSHGLMSGYYESQRFSHIKKYFHESGIGTAGVYYPGHGPRKEESYSIQESVCTLENTISHFYKKYRIPLSVLGVSIGSSIISLLPTSIFQRISSVIFFSYITDLSAFKRFRFTQKHWERWKVLGYSRDYTISIFRRLEIETKANDSLCKLHVSVKSITVPKLFIHGLNDRISSYHDIVGCLDDHSSLSVYSGIEGSHDIRGFPLECATNTCVQWVLHNQKKCL